ncbi:hypothetical protein Tco_0944598 [Tanacetum coccineum]
MMTGSEELLNPETGGKVISLVPSTSSLIDFLFGAGFSLLTMRIGASAGGRVSLSLELLRSGVSAPTLESMIRPLTRGEPVPIFLLSFAIILRRTFIESVEAFFVMIRGSIGSNFFCFNPSVSLLHQTLISGRMVCGEESHKVTKALVISPPLCLILCTLDVYS